MVYCKEGYQNIFVMIHGHLFLIWKSFLFIQGYWNSQLIVHFETKLVERYESDVWNPFISVYFRKTMSIKPTLWKWYLIYIIISVPVCPQKHGCERNNSPTNSSTIDPFILSHLNNASYVGYTPKTSCEESTSHKYIAMVTFSAIVMVLGIIGTCHPVFATSYRTWLCSNNIAC